MSWEDQLREIYEKLGIQDQTPEDASLYVEKPRGDPGTIMHPAAVLWGYVKGGRLIVLKPDGFPCPQPRHFYLDNNGEIVTVFQEVAEEAEPPRLLRSRNDLDSIIEEHAK